MSPTGLSRPEILRAPGAEEREPSKTAGAISGDVSGKEALHGMERRAAHRLIGSKLKPAQMVQPDQVFPGTATRSASQMPAIEGTRIGIA